MQPFTCKMDCTTFRSCRNFLRPHVLKFKATWDQEVDMRWPRSQTRIITRSHSPILFLHLLTRQTTPPPEDNSSQSILARNRLNNAQNVPQDNASPKISLRDPPLSFGFDDSQEDMFGSPFPDASVNGDDWSQDLLAALA